MECNLAEKTKVMSFKLWYTAYNIGELLWDTIEQIALFFCTPLRGDKVSMLTHSYPHIPPEED